jgi:hypothetical protein
VASLETTEAVRVTLAPVVVDWGLAVSVVVVAVNDVDAVMVMETALEVLPP